MKWPRAFRRVLLWAAASMTVMVMWMAAPLALRRLSFFRVRQVELVGIRYLDADQVLAALGLSPRASVFDDTNVLAERLRGLDGVADASVIRRPPASLKVIVREIEPVALVANGRGALTPGQEVRVALIVANDTTDPANEVVVNDEPPPPLMVVP